MFTDTDSLAYEIKCEDLYEDFKDISHLLDTSNYPEGHSLRSTDHEKEIGFFKDECGGVPATHFVGLRPKMYSLLQLDSKEKRTAKGVGGVAQKSIRHGMYVKCLHDEVQTAATFDIIRSTNHELTTTTINKIGLSPFDDKRYLLPSTSETLAYGHYRIREMQ